MPLACRKHACNAPPSVRLRSDSAFFSQASSAEVQFAAGIGKHCASSVLYIDKAAGPVTLYVNEFKMRAGSVVAVDPNPEKFAVYVVSTKAVALKGGSTSYHGVVYAPKAPLSLSGSGMLAGAFVGKSLSMSGTSTVRYDRALRRL